MQKRYLIFMPVLLAALAAAVFLTQSPPQPVEDKVAVTWGLLGEVVHRLTDGQVEVFQILPAGTEIHDWEPTPDVPQKLRGSKLLLWTVEGFDEWGKKMAQNVGVRAASVTNGIKMIELDQEPHSHRHSHAVDPHVWLSPSNMKKIVENIAAILVEVFPEKRQNIETNKAKYISEIDQLYTEFTTRLAPHRNKIFITQHNAFQYLAKSFGLNVVAVLGHEENEPSPQHLSEIYEIIKSQRIKVVFAEDGFVHPVLPQISRDTGTEIRMLYTMETIMVDDYVKGQGYISLMRKNLQELADAFEQ